MSDSTILLITCALAAIAGAGHLVAAIFHVRGNVKDETLTLDATTMVTDVEAAIPSGKAAVIGVIVKDVETEIEKVAPGSSATAAMVRLKAVLKAAGLVGLLLMALFAGGCASFWSSLPTVVTVEQTAETAVASIQAFADSYFVAHPDAATQAKVDEALTKTRQALLALEAATKATTDVHDSNVAAAIADVEQAYEQLLSLVAPMGVAPPSTAVAAGAGPRLTVPARLAQ